MSLPSSALQSLWHDFDAREELLRRLVTERLAASPAPRLDDAIVATYFFALRSRSLRRLWSQSRLTDWV